MPRARSENRERALNIFKEHNGKITNRSIAEQLGISEKTVGGWKCKDRWDDQLKEVLHINKRSTPEPKNPPGAPKGNQNAKGNRGGHGAPLGNKRAVKTGEYEVIWFDTLDEDELQLVDKVETDPLVQVDQEIKLYTIRERRMMQRIQDVKHGLSEKQIRVLQERQSIKEAVPVYDEATGSQKTLVRSRDDMVITEREETSYRIIEDLINLEEALTRVQDKKAKLLDIKQRLISNGDEVRRLKLEEQALQIEKLKAEVEKIKSPAPDDLVVKIVDDIS